MVVLSCHPMEEGEVEEERHPMKEEGEVEPCPNVLVSIANQHLLELNLPIDLRPDPMMKVEVEEAVVAKVQHHLVVVVVVLEMGRSIHKTHRHCNIPVLDMRCIRLIAMEHSGH